ncbi:hypothetical protein T4D_5955 [Trichinella pseudospiralis]|uniref:Uncharacterized protein n=1 Tax=Trichinella pseudospiralis TaxID=6337 RepID=A0A0V1DMT2_TRIPS|nr:hypothetical protein T4D_5955 [Trichinella pseudospiralis]
MTNSEAEQHSDFGNHPYTHHFSHSISLKMEMLTTIVEIILINMNFVD